MKRVLISSFDMEVGGVERSLLSMLEAFDYERYKVDLMLYSHTGDFMPMLPKGPRLLDESHAYKTFRLNIGQIMKQGQWLVGCTRILAKYKALWKAKAEPGYKQMQYMWRYAIPFLPAMEQSYDVAISYLWPHYFVANKVKATTKIAWIHTDYSMAETDEKLDVAMWDQFHTIIAVSEHCKEAFIQKYPSLKSKIKVMENITSESFVIKRAMEPIESPICHDTRFKIVTVARLSHAKGIDQAVKALKILKSKGYNQLVWYVVGYGGDEALIRKLIQDNNLENDFILLGKQLNPYPYMDKADLYVQPSRYEGKAVTVVEAQILAKPVMITNYTTARSQVEHGVNGYITALSVDGIAEGIEKLYLDQRIRKELVNNCKKMEFATEAELDKLYSII